MEEQEMVNNIMFNAYTAIEGVKLERDWDNNRLIVSYGNVKEYIVVSQEEHIEFDFDGEEVLAERVCLKSETYGCISYYSNTKYSIYICIDDFISALLEKIDSNQNAKDDEEEDDFNLGDDGFDFSLIDGNEEIDFDSSDEEGEYEDDFDFSILDRDEENDFDSSDEEGEEDNDDFDFGDFDKHDDSRFSKPGMEHNPSDLSTVTVSKLMFNNTLIGYRFQLPNSFLDLSGDKGKELGIVPYKVQKSIDLQEINGVLVSDYEYVNRVRIPDISDDDELCRELMEIVFGF